MNHKEELAKLRLELDEIDGSMVELLERRLRISEKVGDIKADGNMPLTDEAREREVIERAAASAEAGDRAEAASLMRTLIALSKIKQRYRLMPRSGLHFPAPSQRKQGEVSAVYQGMSGAWGEQAAMEMFPGARLDNAEYFEDVFAAVKEGRADFGVVPIENSATGAIGEVYDLLRRHGCFITGQIWIPIKQCLLVKEGTSPDRIREVLSHPQGFGQCRRYLKNKGWDLVSCRNTAVAARMVSERDDMRAAAIGSRRAAEAYGLSVAAPDIMDDADNQTRFIAIAASPIYDKSCDSTSITFSTHNQSGALCTVLQAFMHAGISLNRIESRPVSADRYRFFADLDANILDENAAEALKEAAVQCEYFEVLGCYKTSACTGGMP